MLLEGSKMELSGTSWFNIVIIVMGCVLWLVSLVTLKNIIVQSVKIYKIVKSSDTVFGQVVQMTEHEEHLGKAQWTSYTPTISYKVNNTSYVIENFKVTNAEPYYKGRVVIVIYSTKNPQDALIKLDMNSNEYINADSPLKPQRLLIFLCTLIAGFVCLYFRM
jgi:hypothetical protein